MSRWLCVAGLLAACGGSAEPRLAAIDPAVASSLVATPAVLAGSELVASARVRLDGTDPAQLDRAWGVRIDDLAVADVTWRTTSEIDLVIPAGLAIGTHDLTAIAPTGAELALPGALTIVAEPIHLALSIEDAPAGAGAPIGQVVTAGDSVELFAVVRDHGAFVVDTEVTWAATAGSLAAGPTSHATFRATATGTAQITATRAAAGLTAQAGLTVVAAAASQIAIVDAPGSAGAPIGDRTGLTTDSDGGLLAFAVSLDAFGNFVADAPVTWSLTGVAGIFAAGPSASVAIDFSTPGIGTLHAGGAQTGNLTVIPGRAAQLAISPPALSVSADAAPVGFTATALDGDGNATTNTGALTWSIASGPITAIDPASGSFTPTAAGTGTIAIASSLGPIGRAHV